MKISLPKDSSPNRKFIILPLTGTTSEEVGKFNSKAFDILLDPTNAAGAKFKQNYRILTGNEDLRTKIQWCKDTLEVLNGTTTAITLVPCVAIVKSLTNQHTHGMFLHSMNELAQVRYDMNLEAANATDVAAGNTLLGDALRAVGVQQNIGDTEAALTLTIACDLPFKCLQKVKRYMRRECRKPYEMKAREYANHLVRINTEEIPFIPPAAANQELSNDELIDILLFGTPKSWQREMDRQGFDPLDNTIQAVVAFMERIEESEDPQMRDKKPSAVSNNNSNGKKPASC